MSDLVEDRREVVADCATLAVAGVVLVGWLLYRMFRGAR